MEKDMQFCQSYGMPLTDEVLGTNADGSKNEDYCMYCYKDGKFLQDCTMDEMIEQAMQTENSSVRRLSLNIVERLEMHEDDLRTDFLDFCFDHMINVEEFPGIQSVCMKLAFRMCTFYPELMDELKRTLEAMEIDYYKPAVKGVRSKILSGKLMMS